MNMRIVRIGADLVNSGKPRSPVFRDEVCEALHELPALVGIQLAGQRDRELVGNTRILAVVAFFAIQPGLRDLSVIGHPSGEDNGSGFGSGDVSNMRTGRPRSMGASTDAAHVQAVNGYAALLPKIRSHKPALR